MPDVNFLRDFVGLERAADLFSFKDQGVSIWWFVRQRAYGLLKQKVLGIDFFAKTADSLSALDGIRRTLSAFPRLRANPYQPARLLALSTASARRHVTESGHAYNIFFDFFASIPTLDYGVLELPDRSLHARLPFSAKSMYGDRITIQGNVGRLVAAPAIRARATDELSNRLVDLSISLGIPLSLKEARRLVSREAAFVRHALPAARMVLERTRPSILLVECGYSPCQMVVQLLAKDRGVPIVEFQHGFISTESVGYFFGCSTDSQVDCSPFPDHLLLFGDHFRRLLEGNTHIGDHRMVTIGYPYLWLQRRLHARTNRTQGQGIILITSQPGLGPFWAHFAVELAAKSESQVVIKPHPSEMDRVPAIYQEALGLDRVTVLMDARSLYELLATAKFHLSVASTSHLEALVFGVKDIVVSVGGIEEQFGFLREIGLPFADSVDEVIEVMRNYPDIEPIREYVNQEIFTLHRNPIDAARRFLERYL